METRHAVVKQLTTRQLISVVKERFTRAKDENAVAGSLMTSARSVVARTSLSTTVQPSYVAEKWF